MMVSRTTPLDFWRTDFSLFSRLVDSLPIDSQRGSSEGQMSPGRLDVLQEQNLKGSGAGCPHVPKDKPTQRMTDLAEQRTLAGTQE